MSEAAMPVLAVEGLSVTFEAKDGDVRAAEEVSFTVARGATVGIVGESGCGKTVTGLSLLGMTRDIGARVGGRVLFEGTDLVSLATPELVKLRGAKIAMIFQDPMASLNPAHRIGEQVMEPLALHRPELGKAERRARAIALLAEVGIPDPEERMRAYPHQLSGGMRQRVMIASALACEPALLVADEPTTALDATIQAQIVELLVSLQRAHGMSILLISHDLGLIAEVCSEVIVMYAGRVVERGPTREVLVSPRHPYTAGLIAGAVLPGGPKARLPEIPGVVPDLRHPPRGCRFEERCGFRQARCGEEEPRVSLCEGESGREVRCHFPLPKEPGS